MDRLNTVLDISYQYPRLSEAAHYVKSSKEYDYEGDERKMREAYEKLTNFELQEEDRISLSNYMGFKEEITSDIFSDKESSSPCQACNSHSSQDLRLSKMDLGHNNYQVLKSRGLTTEMFKLMTNSAENFRIRTYPVCNKDCQEEIEIFYICNKCIDCQCSLENDQSYMIFPVDDTRQDYVQKFLHQIREVPYKVIEAGISGVFAEHLGKCSKCINCSQCKSLLNNQSVSLKKMQEDMLFQESVWIEEETKRIMASLPIDENYRDKLEPNRPGAATNLIRQIKGTHGMPVSRKQLIDAFIKYTQTHVLLKEWHQLSEYEQKCILSEKLQYYMYVTFAYKNDSRSSKARLCMNASSTYKGSPSLNSLLPTGSNTIDIVRNVQRFLTQPHIILGDVSIFYCSFHLDPKQYHIQRFLWQPELDPKGELKEYFITRLFFGLAPVGRLCSVGLEKLANLYEADGIKEVLLYDFYVDDLLINTGTHTESEKLRDLVEKRLGDHGLKFKGFISCKEDPGDQTESDGHTLYLGLKYFPQEDLFSLKIPTTFRGKKLKGNIEKLEYYEGSSAAELKEFIGNKLTQRALLSKVMQFFDPSGISSPIIGGLRQLIRMGNIESQGNFDCLLSQNIVDEFCDRVTLLDQFKSYKYKRTHHPERSDNYDIDILGFCDAGEISSQLVQYTRVRKQNIVPEEEKQYTISYLGSRNALVKPNSTVPKSELHSLFLLCLALEAERRNLKPHQTKFYAFTDSRVVVHWVYNWSLSLELFHRSRVVQINHTLRDSENILQLYWIDRKYQVADIGTHGNAVPNQVSPDSIFFLGPEFVYHDLAKAEKEGIIIRADKLQFRLDDKQHRDFTEAIIQKHKRLTLLKPSELSDDMVLTKDISPLDSSDNVKASHIFLTQDMNTSKTLYIAGNYLFNPLRLPFRKVVITHMMVIKGIKILLKRCINSGRIEKTQNYKRVLENINERGNRNMGFSFFCNTSYEEFHEENMEIQNELEPDRIRQSMYITDLDWINSDLSISLSADTFRPITSDKVRKWNINSWSRYPGVMFFKESIQLLEDFLSNREEGFSTQIELLESTAAIINAHIFLQILEKNRISEKEKFEGIYFHLASKFNQIRLKITNEIIKDMENILYEFSIKPLHFIKEPTHNQVLALYQWMRCRRVGLADVKCIKLDKECEVIRYSTRAIMMSVFPSPAEFANLQLTVYSLFHDILSREISCIWSNDKLSRFCEKIDNKFVSTWRLRAGFENSQLFSQEMNQDGSEDIVNINPEFNPVTPVGSRHSPLIISLCLHLHYQGKPNLLNRPRIANHFGVQTLRFMLTKSVHVPNSLQLLRDIMHNCVNCKVRLDKTTLQMLGPLPTHSLSVSPSFSFVQMDGYGPLSLRVLHNMRETRNVKLQKFHILCFVCCFSKKVVYELVSDLTASSFALAMIRLGCKEQIPLIVYADQHRAQVSMLKNIEFHVQVNEILFRKHKMRYSFSSTGTHSRTGLIERKIRSLSDVLNTVKLEEGPALSIIQFQTILLQIQQMNNLTPLGISNNKEFDPALQILTPEKLSGTFPKRTPLCSPELPLDIGSQLNKHKLYWSKIIDVYSKVVLPEMLDNKKWFINSEDSELSVGQIVMFKKRPGAHFIGEYSYGRISQLSKPSDGKHRQVYIEYLSPSSEESEGSDLQSKPQFKTTLREARDLIVLFPITDTLNQDLATLHRDIEDYDKSVYRDLATKEVKSFFINPLGNSVTKNRCQACLCARNLPRQSCNICLLLEESRNIQEYNLQLVDKTEFVIREIEFSTDVLEKVVNSIRWKLIPVTTADQLESNLLIKVINHSLGVKVIKNDITPRGIYLKILIKKGTNIKEIIYITVNDENSSCLNFAEPSILTRNNEVENFISTNYKRDIGKDIDIKFITNKIKWPKRSYSLNRSPGKGDIVTCYCKNSFQFPFMLNMTQSLK